MCAACCAMQGQWSGTGRHSAAQLVSVTSCSKIAQAEAAVSVNEKKRLVMHVQLRLDELRAPPNPWLTVT
jgi:hypothetical protein